MDPNTRSFIKQEGINWVSVTAFSVFHVGAVIALFYFSWPAFFTALGLYWISLSLGIGMGYHRLLTHRAYKTPKWIEYFLAVCGSIALEGGPMFWVATHRVHHQFSDKDGDPHTPRDGKWWSHIVWMLVGDATHCNIEQCSGYLQGSVLSLAFEVSLCTAGQRGRPAARSRRLAIFPVGSLLPGDDGIACDLDGQLIDALLGKPQICHSGWLKE
jgi:fatty-acid desaturase